MKNKLHLFIIFIILFSAGYNNSFAQAGTLDSSFGTKGRLKLKHGDNLWVHALCVQPDGKILVGGGFRRPDFSTQEHIVPLIQRYNADGSVDTTFGFEGEKILPYNTSDAGGDFTEWSQIDQIHVLKDGGIYVTLRNAVSQVTGDEGDVSNSEYAIVCKLQPDGSLDQSFINVVHGVSYPDTTRGYDFYSSAITDLSGFQKDGKLIRVSAYWGKGYNGFSLYRHNPNDSIDSSFAVNGQVNIPGMSSNQFENIIVLNNQKIIVAGMLRDKDATVNQQVHDYNNRYELIQITKDGMIDSSFGNNGYAVTKVSDSLDDRFLSDVLSPDDIDYPLNITQLSDGSLLVSGVSGDKKANPVFTTVKFNANGTLNTSFSANGKVVSNFPSYKYSYATANTYSSNGSLSFAAGLIYNNLDAYNDAINDPAIGITAFDNNGTDQSFGDNGYVTTYVTPRDTTSTAEALAIAGDGNLLVAATITETPGKDDMYADNIGGYLLKYRTVTATAIAKNVIAETKPASNYQVYPNPVKDVLQIDGLSSQNEKQISVIGMNGKLMQQSTTSASNYKINTNQLLPGMYILKITDGNNTTTTKFIKE